MIPKFVMMVGLPGSGKSNIASEWYEPDEIFSSDKIREELFGDINDQEHNEEVFHELHKRIKQNLKDGKNAVYDATNINKKRRKSFIDELKSIECIKICRWVATPYKECLRRNAERERFVPEAVIKKMYLNFNPPDYTEGFNEIVVHKKSISDDEYFEYIDKLNIQHDNHHHKLSVAEHCEAVEYYVCCRSNNKLLRRAARLHDIGKPFTKSFVNGRGEKTTDAHYYQHHCVGAYDAAAIMVFGSDDIVYISNLIYWHMHPHTSWKQSEKAMQRDRELISDEMFKDLMLLYEADCAFP